MVGGSWAWRHDISPVAPGKGKLSHDAVTLAVKMIRCRPPLHCQGRGEPGVAWNTISDAAVAAATNLAATDGRLDGVTTVRG